MSRRTQTIALAIVASFVASPGLAAPPKATAPPEAAAPPAAATSAKLKKTQILKIVREHASEVRSCYDRAAKGDPKLAGQLGVEITIGATGRVIRARIRYSTLGRPAVDGCVVHGIRSWVFPKPTGGGEVVFVYPFVFQQKGGKPAVPKRLTKKLVAQGMRAVLGEVRRCNKRFKQPGTAKVRTTIGKSGQVSQATIEAAPFAGTEAGGCIEAAVRTARFPRFTGDPITFTYPFVLK